MRPKLQDLNELGLLPIARWVSQVQTKQENEPSAQPASDPSNIPSASDEPIAPMTQANMVSLSQLVANCRKCKLCETRTNTAFGRGDTSIGKLLLVGEGPGEEEDRRGLPFVGQAGKLLSSMLGAIGIDEEKDVYITNVIKCRPPGNRNPKEDEIDTCMPYLKRQIELLKPRLIVALGKVASNALLENNLSMREMRGKKHDYNDLPLLAHYHPAYLLRTPTAKRLAWQDWLEARRVLDETGS